jgi:hypothetical protein
VAFDYQRYLASREWALLKRQVHERADGGQTCERCLASSRIPGRVVVAAVHHRTYERIGHEQLEDLLGVCRGCHEFLSGVSTNDPLRELLEDEVKNHFGSTAMLAALLADPNRTWTECAELAHPEA